MDQTLKNEKKPNFEPDFGLFGLNLEPQNFFWGGVISTSS